MSEATKTAYWWNDKPVVPTFNRYFDVPDSPIEPEATPLEEKIREYARETFLCELSEEAIKSLVQGARVQVDENRYMRLRNGNEIVVRSY